MGETMNVSKSKKTFVIGLSAVSGGGKTTVSKLLNRKYENSKILHFDDYDFNGPDDIVSWIEGGGDPNEWDLTPFIKDLEKLLNESPDCIILDYPFSYQHNQVQKYIDYSIFIDTPLDIALVRRVIRDHKASSAENIMMDMSHYISRGRRAYLSMLTTIKPTADLVVDGTLKAHELTEVIFEQLKRSIYMPSS